MYVSISYQNYGGNMKLINCTKRDIEKICDTNYIQAQMRETCHYRNWQVRDDIYVSYLGYKLNPKFKTLLHEIVVATPLDDGTVFSRIECFDDYKRLIDRYSFHPFKGDAEDVVMFIKVAAALGFTRDEIFTLSLQNCTSHVNSLIIKPAEQE